jgi:hypothetical protein
MCCSSITNTSWVSLATMRLAAVFSKQYCLYLPALRRATCASIGNPASAYLWYVAYAAVGTHRLPARLVLIPHVLFSRLILAATRI